jgi:VIT1/CCC1 family predicted Fe2+/Mn2+ transporter
MRHHSERHVGSRTNWLRAAILGANDGVLSTSSLLVGIAASDALPSSIAIAGIAGLVAGAFSMGAGEYVSVSSQADLERAELAREARELKKDPGAELAELTAIYRARGLSDTTAQAVARELSSVDSLAAHARDELGLSLENRPNPVQAALASAASFSAGAAIPLAMVAIVSANALVASVICVTLLSLGVLGALGALAGGAPLSPAILRVTTWGAMAMASTWFLGHLTRGFG